MPYGGNPSGSDDDALKLLIGDTSTSTSGELLSTGECGYFVSSFGSVRAAAPHAARAIAAGFASLVGKSIGDLRLEAQQKFDHWSDLAKQLERQSAIVGVPFAGGISRAQKRAVESDTDRVTPAFRVGLHDYNATSTGST